jgi:hypothetical protein
LFSEESIFCGICYIIPFKKIVEKRGKGLGMLNMYRDVSRDREGFTNYYDNNRRCHRT